MANEKPDENATPPGELRREVGLTGAVMMGLGSMVGTGVFVSIGTAAGVTGPAVVLAIAVAAVVATCNGLSSAQLAANCPVSGGTYEYGYRWLTPALGFTAGWMFLCAKCASAATAALGFAGYARPFVGDDAPRGLLWLALPAVWLLTLLVLSGVRRSNATNIVIVSVTLASLAYFVAAGAPTAWEAGARHLTPFLTSTAEGASPLAGFLEACALMFVAFTGYGRIATLGEEVHHPRRTIPLAIIITLFVAMTLYVLVGLVGVASVGAETLAAAGTQHAAPLEAVARRFTLPAAATVVAIGAVTAMLGVLLNLILGLSRVLLAMGRKGDAPAVFARVGAATATPYAAVLAVGAAIAGLALIGDVKSTWSFSAFTVLVYYAITNLAALRLSEGERLYPRFVPGVGLAACLFLAFWVETQIWLIGLALIAAGLAGRSATRLMIWLRT